MSKNSKVVLGAVAKEVRRQARKVREWRGCWAEERQRRLAAVAELTEARHARKVAEGQADELRGALREERLLAGGLREALEKEREEKRHLSQMNRLAKKVRDGNLANLAETNQTIDRLKAEFAEAMEAAASGPSLAERCEVAVLDGREAGGYSVQVVRHLPAQTYSLDALAGGEAAVAATASLPTVSACWLPLYRALREALPGVLADVEGA